MILGTRQSTRRAASLFLGALFLIFAFVVYANLTQPEIKKIISLRGTLKTKLELRNEQRVVVEQVKKLITEFKSVRNIQETISLVLPESEETAALVGQLQAITKLSGLTMNAVTLRSALEVNRSAENPRARVSESLSSSGSRGVIDVSLKLVGSYDGFKSFLGFIRKNVRLTDVMQVKIVPFSNTIAGVYAYELSVRSYFYQSLPTAGVVSN